jgi:hypothetical protein
MNNTNTNFDDANGGTAHSPAARILTLSWAPGANFHPRA